ncbi:protein CutA homolog [Kryptolebias marmoratus]|uniref:Zgc:63972 n=1 Tax=Kryptolebias marmoratus TaxID=37003 RepID=A0A3Q3FG14_KRYMA|nr:protein CutA homolog [Kryptolebias marmoratus]XP_024859873.1 protein CutA homolog [Kryptolebias marmoratus]XP_037835448.1 protein CutA homolog [Kryptolebias marmoratus]
MAFTEAKRMQLPLQRCHREALTNAALRSVLLITSLFLVLSVSMYPGLRSLAVRLHAVLTGGYTPGHYSVLLINSPNEQGAKDIGRAVMERRLAAGVNVFPKTSTMYYWKGEIQDATETLILVRTKTSRIQQIMDFVRSIHPYSNPEVLSFPVEDSSLAYMKWMDEAIPDD